MSRLWNCNCGRALLASIAVLSCGFPSMLTAQARPPKARAAAEPFATFHLLDRQLSVLEVQSAALRKTLDSPQTGNVNSARRARSKAVREMRQTLAKIRKMSLRLRRRYRRKAFAARLFGRLQARAVSVEAGLKMLISARRPDRARTAASEVDRRIVTLGLQYNAITGGYAALSCTPGQWTCCEPKPQGEAASEACRWICTKQVQSCRGFAGPRAAMLK
jgi:hypothetical protein